MTDLSIVLKQFENMAKVDFSLWMKSVKLLSVSCMVIGSLASSYSQCPIGNNVATCSGSEEVIQLNYLLTNVPPSGAWFWDGNGPTPAGFDEDSGTFTPALSQAGAYTFGYHYYAHNGCNIDGTTYAIVNVLPSANTGLGSHVLSCNAAGVDQDIDLYSLLSGEQPGGTWNYHPSNPTGGNFNPISGTFNPDGAYGKYKFTYTIESGICPAVSSDVFITVQNDPLQVGVGSNTNICSSSNSIVNLYNLIDGEDHGGLWSPLVTNPLGGTFSPEGTFNTAGASSTPPSNVYGFTYSFPSNCISGPNSAVIYITINEQSNPGLHNEISICAGAPTITLIDELVGVPDPNGTWSANPSIGFGTGTFDPSAQGVVTGAYTFTYTFLPSQGCGSAESTLIINVIDQPSVGDDGDLYICQGSQIPLNLYDVVIGEDEGGNWQELPAGSVVSDPYNLDVSSLIPGVYTYEYSTNVLPGCGMASISTATLIVNGPQPEAGPGGQVTSCNGIVDLTGGLTFIVSPGGIWKDNNKSGVDLSDPTNVDFAGLSQGLYSFSYIFGANTGCHTDEALISVLIPSNPPAVGQIAQLNVCENSKEILDLSSVLINTDPGGLWTDNLSNPVSQFVDISTLPAIVGSQTFIFNYDFGPSQNCPSVGTSVELTVWEQKNAGTGSDVTVCEGNGILTLSDFVSNYEMGGVWSISGANSHLGILDVANGTYDFTGALPGIYYFAYTQTNTSPCISEQSIVTMTIMTAVDQLDAPQTIAICEGSTEIIDLREFVLNKGASEGGSFSLLAGIPTAFDEITGIFNPQDVPAVTTFIIEHNFDGTCAVASETITITVNSTLSAGTAQNVTFCKEYAITNTIDLWSQLSNFDLGGTWIDENNTGIDLSNPAAIDASTLLEGTYAFTYKFFASGECDKNYTTVFLNCINDQPYVGYGSNNSICEGSDELLDLTSLISGAQIGGNWIDLDGAAVDISDPSTVDFSSVSPGAYVFRYEFLVLGTCATDAFVDVTISISDLRDAGDDDVFTVCGDLTTILPFDISTGGDAGGTWTNGDSNPPGTVINNNDFVPANAFPGTYVFEYNFTPSGGCEGDKSVVTVYVLSGNPVTIAQANPESICAFSPGTYSATNLLTQNSSPGGIWSVDPTTPLPAGSMLNANTGDIITETLSPGTYLLNYSFSSTVCGAVRGVDGLELVVEPTVVGEDGVITICDHQDALIDLESLLGLFDSPAAGVWTDLDGSGVTLNNPGAVDFSSTKHGAYRFELSVNEGLVACSPDASVATVIVSSQPSAGIGGKHEVCMFTDGDIIVDLNTLLSGQDPGGVWSGPQPEDGGSFDPLTGLLTVTSATTIRSYSYTYSFDFGNDSPCTDDSATLKIKVTNDCGNTTPCFATQRYNAGSRWNDDNTINDNATDGGIVKCGMEGTFMTLDAPSFAYDPDLFEIDLAGTSFYDPYNGYMMTAPLPQVGEDIIWINFDVRAFVSSFEILLQDDEHLAWALYKSNVHTTGTSLFTPNESTTMELSGDCSSLSLVRSGLSSEMWNTIMIDYKDFTQAHNYYIAIWDWSDNVNIGDGPNGGVVNAFGTRMGCEVEDICTAPIIKNEPSFIDHKDGTYSIIVDIQGINGLYKAVDKTGSAISISDPICLTNSSADSPVTSGSFTLTYPNTVGYAIEIAAQDPTSSIMCGTAENYHYCATDLLTPPQAPFEVICDGGYDAEQVYHGFGLIPDNSATDVAVLSSCGGQDIHVTFGDIIRQKGSYLYEVERVYTVFSGCQLPGKEDDQQATCSVYYTVDYSAYKPNNTCDLACNLNGINIGINEDCEALITPEMVLEGPNQVCASDYYLVLTDPANKNRKVPNPVNKNYIGKTLQAQVYHINGNQIDNSCWGYVTVEDKLPPMIYCPKPDTISCNAVFPVINLAAWVEDACAHFKIEKINETLEDFDCDPYGEFAALQTVTYVAIDESGNTSLPCEHKVYFAKDTVIISDFPNDVSISCEDAQLYDHDGDGYPDPSFTGAPSLGGQQIGKSHGHCQIQASFEDQIIPLCDQSYKILRKWTVLDWCRPTTEAENNPIFDYQIIKVEDKSGPEMVCESEDAVYDSDPLECGLKKMKVNMPEINFDCGSGDFRYVIGHKKTVPGDDPYNKPDTTGVYFENGEYWIESMPYGDSWVVCSVYDLCGNYSSCYYKVTVKDYVAPIPVCDENTVVTLSSDNNARVWAESFNDGSFDFCSDVTLSVARRDGHDCDETEPTFKEYIDFCCKDIGQEHMVVLKVTDESENHNSCMVRVQIVDKHIPKFHSYPEDHYVYCYENLDSLDFGKPSVDEECNSYSMDYEDISQFNQCKVGKIVRRWHLWDAEGNEMDRYDQEIHIELDKPFKMDPSYWPPNYDAEAECDIEVSSPEIAGKPLTDIVDGCTLIAATYEDEEFHADAEACLKVLRRWTVVDWCQYDENLPSNQNPGIWKYTQKITINNVEPPQFAEACTIVNRINSTDNCYFAVEITANVSDDCTPTDQLKIKYEITFEGGDTASGNGLTYSSTTVPSGMHTITWTAQDKCGNTTVCSEEFLLDDDKAPTPYCLAEVSTVISPSTMDVDLWAIDFDLGSYDNCPNAELTFLMKVENSQDTLSPSVRFDCSHVGPQDLEIWIFDSSGNADFCHTVVDVQANVACENQGNGVQNEVGSMALISGHVHTESNEAVENVMIRLDHISAKTEYTFETGSNGQFSFSDMPMYDDYQIVAERNDDPLNGVSTLDMVLIQKHILGTLPLDSPYKIIAADVNNSQSLSAVDIISLRQVVLGNKSTFPNNVSWRFVNKAQQFLDADNPWPFIESIGIDELDTEESISDFVAIKVGDVNNSAQFNQNMAVSSSRSYEALALSIENNSYEDGETIDVPLVLDHDFSLTGMQFTLSYDQSKAEIQALHSDLLDLTPQQYSIFKKEGQVTVSWNGKSVKDLEKGVELITLRFKTLATGSVEDLNLDIDSAITKSEAYTDKLEISDITLKSSNRNYLESFELYQNSPNPFSDKTIVEFYIEKPAINVTLTIIDVGGKLIYTESGDFDAGKNKIVLHKENLNSSGLLYYRLQVGDEVATKSMLSIE